MNRNVWTERIEMLESHCWQGLSDSAGYQICNKLPVAFSSLRPGSSLRQDILEHFGEKVPATIEEAHIVTLANFQWDDDDEVSYFLYVEIPMTEQETAEIARFKDTGKTIKHRGIEFAIFNPPDDEHRAESPYILRSPRGKYYALLRNTTDKRSLFGVNLYAADNLQGRFSDKNGELESLG